MPDVLVVEDDPANRVLAKRILEAHGYRHAAAGDGQDALARAAARRPDLILLDLSMPGLDGWEVARRVRRDPGLAGVRILALTAHAMRGDRERALAAGCDGYLAKPYRPAELLAAIERVTTPVSASPTQGGA